MDQRELDLRRGEKENIVACRLDRRWDGTPLMASTARGPQCPASQQGDKQALQLAAVRPHRAVGIYAADRRGARLCAVPRARAAGAAKAA
jgi:hypothetical protein